MLDHGWRSGISISTSSQHSPVEDDFAGGAGSHGLEALFEVFPVVAVGYSWSILSPDWSITVILYQVSYISRP